MQVNGNEYAKRQAAKAGIGFTPMDNAFAAVDDVAALQAICHVLGPAQIDALLRKWLARLPHPFSPADRAAGYRYDISILQAEFSLTQMLDKPVSGRIFFEQVIRDNLDVGRPDRISLIFGRSIYRGRKNHTPGTLATRVVTDGVTPSLHVLYKHTAPDRSHPARPPTTCAGSASTASSSASRTPATRSPAPARGTPCSSPASTTGSCKQDSPNSPDRTQHPCAKPPPSTSPPSTTSPSEQE